MVVLNGGKISEEFLRLYVESRVWMNTYWLGVNVLKCPLDLWMYQEVLCRTRPDTIIETGTWNGGSALFLASVCDQLGNGRIITVDIEKRPRRRHRRITYITGSSLDIVGRLNPSGRVMVILDSDHSKDHVLDELHAYSPLVSEGCYLIVEDTGISIVNPGFGPGPAEAVEEFLAEDSSFTVDRNCEKFLLTTQPGGYLLKEPASN
jgi:cephalosporin hydroxylase